jgi:TfoX/Sxy family transcriptional regulator of competence genes
MAYNKEFTEKVRQALAGKGSVEERHMFGALGFMINGKLSICVGKNSVMYKLGPDQTKEALDTKNAEPVVMGNRTMKGWVNLNTDSMVDDDEFDKWLKLALAYNQKHAS